MKIFCWNVRGLNTLSRQRFIRGWIGTNKPLIGSVLETHVSEVNAERILQSTFPGWKWITNYSHSEGGRIWVVWDPSISVFCFKQSAQLVMCGVFVPASNESFSVTFVYAFNTVIQRRALWDELTFIAHHSPARFRPWLTVGDFNQILLAAEHHSETPHNLPINGMNELHNCLVENEISDLASRGVFYTWYNGRPEDPVLRKLDRALVNEEWSSSFPDSVAIFDPPGDSDHSPCLVITDASVEASKKSFKYFSFFSTHPSFLEKLSEAWVLEVCVGSKLFMFGQRMKKIKLACKLLNKSGFGNLQQKTKDSLASLESLQATLLTNPSSGLFREEFVLRQKWNFFSQALEGFFKQKSRIRWLQDGDANTAFFHKAVLAHQATNCIKYLRGSDGQRIENMAQIKDMTVDYFRSLLGSESVGSSPMSVEQIQGLVSFRCPQNLFPQLIVVPSDLEIQQTLRSMPRNKAPGPDGFPMEFYIEAWEVVGTDLVAAVKDFFISGIMPQCFNATAIALIPKVPGADSLTEFRPVSLCTTVYKIIARIIKKRLKLFINEAVQQNQVGFVKGRLLCENVLLASELISNFNVEGVVTRGCLQIDLTKAYDSLDWNFLLNILRAIHLPEVFIKWIQECISSTSFSIAFNGELLGFFPGKKGLRQGDPISSLLFVLAMDVLSKQLDKGAVNQVFRIHPKCEAPLVTHLSFADDVLIFFDGSEASLMGILSILDEFRETSGLRVNTAKTALFLDGGDYQLTQAVAGRVGLQSGCFPVKYLGVPLTSKKLRKQDYQPLLDRISKRLESWTIRHLSFAGRLQLIKSVIYSTITFWASIFLLPNQCLAEIERMCSGFLWRGVPNSARGAKVSWESVCTPKECGGLGLRRLLPWNKVLGLKLIWLLFAAGGSLWVSWVRRHLIGNASFWDLDANCAGSWLWRSLCKLRIVARPFIICEIGSGISCSFWRDNWTLLGPLIELTGASGPRVSGLPLNSVVADAVRNGEWWLTSSRSRNPIIALLKQCLPLPQLLDNAQEDDSYLWRIGVNSPSALFSTSQTWHHLNPPGIEVSWHEGVWFKGRIPKHAFISWLAVRNRLHTRDRLLRWGLPVPSSCLLCNAFDESLQHLFFDCVYSSEVWIFFCSRALVTPPTLFEQAVRWLKNPSRNLNITLILRLSFQATLYALWKERNSRLHSQLTRPPAALILDINNSLRCRLDPLSRVQVVVPPNLSYLATWIDLFQS